MRSLLQKASQGFTPLPLPDALKQAALSNIELWLSDSRFADYQPSVEKMIESERFELLLDSFYKMMPFGTGGRRGSVGVGPNRINPFTITTSVQGHCAFLESRFPRTQISVVAACDTRCFNDLNCLYKGIPLGPLQSLSSRDLCRLAAQVYAANGVQVWIADPAEDTYISTPELSFLIYHLKAHGGINISASHNPPDDNGSKFYNAAGGQEVPPYDEELVNSASSVLEARLMPFDLAVQEGLIRFVTADLHNSYIRENTSLTLRPGQRSATVAFSPLHGVGSTSALPVLKSAGFQVAVCEKQMPFDGSFSSVPFRTPNPEVPTAMQAVIDTSRSTGADIALATDPDADRLGLAVPDNSGSWRCLTGNQIGLLLAWHILSCRKADDSLRPSCYVVKTEVTTRALERMAQAFGVRCIGHLLVGFKYIGDVLDQVARTGRWLDFPATESDFLMGMEESHGVLVSPRIRDKDAANGALLIAELASVCKEQGTSIWQTLMNIYKQFGYFGTALKSVVMEGAPGLQSIAAIQASLRTDPPTSIGGRRVLSFHDRLDPNGVFGPIKSATDAASRDVLVFELDGDIRLVLRPSGTEPKNKTYAEWAGQPLGTGTPDSQVEAQMAESSVVLRQLLDCFEQDLMRRAGFSFPAYASGFADSIPVDRKLRFVDTVAPRLAALAQNEPGPQDTRDEFINLVETIAPLPHLADGIRRFAHTMPVQQGSTLLAWLDLALNGNPKGL